jgi:two-component system, sensor histidine kinase
MNKVKVLLVDDRPENLFSLGLLLDELDVELYKVQSGAKALELMVEHAFALAILDVQMPDMDGFELAELMRGAHKTQNIPIIFVTAASPASGFAFKGYELGAVDFLFKPLDPIMFKSKVKVFIELETQKILLRQSKEVAENANRLKSSFLANMSHEIRTPLGALMGFAELLEDENLSKDDRQKYIKTIKRNGIALTNLIDDILDLSKVEAGHLDVVKEEICVINLVEEVLILLGKTAEQKGLKINFKTQGQIPYKIISDEKRIRQILMNIVGNAIKFTEKGHIDVLLIAEMNWATSTKLTFKVTDTGVGIDPGKINKLFKPFMQADNSVTRKFGGTGLGLALSKKLAQLLGGDLFLETSEPQKGSTFVIYFNVEHKEESAQKKVEKQEIQFVPADPVAVKSLQNCRILVVEDSKDNQALMEILLKRKGAKVEFANNGEEGYQKALANQYDIVLMDIQMPIQDGYVTVQKLKDKNYSKPIIALTAHAMADEKEKCIEVGCVDFLSKPINQVQLIDKIIFHLDQK